MNNAHGLSIVVPTYNRSRFVETCLHSICSMVYRPLEVVVVDDGSTDDTVEIVRNFEQEYQTNGINFKVVESEHAGAQVARNTGSTESQFNYILFLDSDDELISDGLDKLMAVAEEISPELIVGVVHQLDASQRLLSKIGRCWVPGDVSRILRYDWHTNGAIYRKDFIERIGGWHVDLEGSQDWEIQVRAKSLVDHIIFQPVAIATWLMHDGTRIGTSKFRKNYTEHVVRACALCLGQLKLTKKATFWNCVRVYAKVGVHLKELSENGVGHAEVKSLVHECFSASKFDSVCVRLPWDLVTRFWGRVARK